MNMKVLIWDFNGTIVDDVQLCLDVENEMMKKRQMKKYPIDIQFYKEHFCFPVKNYYHLVGYTFEEETFEQVSVEFTDGYDAGFSKVKLCKGFQEKILEAKQKGYMNVILSASFHDKLIEQCKILKIDHLFQEILGIDNLFAGSKIDMAKNWLTSAKINPDECMYLGDTIHDKEVADALGIKNYYLIANGHQSKKVLLDATLRVLDDLTQVNL